MYAKNLKREFHTIFCNNRTIMICLFLALFNIDRQNNIENWRKLLALYLKQANFQAIFYQKYVNSQTVIFWKYLHPTETWKYFINLKELDGFLNFTCKYEFEIFDFATKSWTDW